MITIPSQNYLGTSVKRVLLHHSGGIGSTLVLYYLMKDIVDRGLDVSINVVNSGLPGRGRFKDSFFAHSTTKKCQELTGFDSDRLIYQAIDFDRTTDSEGKPLHLEYFYRDGTRHNITASRILTPSRLRRSIVFDSEFYDTHYFYDSEFVGERNILNYSIIQTLLATLDSENDEFDEVDIAAAVQDYKTATRRIQTVNTLSAQNICEIVYTGNYRNPPTSVQSNFDSGQGVTTFEDTRGYNANVDSEFIDIDSELGGKFWYDSEVQLHWWQLNPLMSKGDSKDLYDLFYSQDSDLEELFWYTRSCNNGFGERFSYEEIHSDSDLLREWDSESPLYLPDQDRFIYQIQKKPLHRFIPHCRKCWRCQNRGYGFEAWLDSEDDFAWLRSENAFNPTPVSIPSDAIIIYTTENGGSLPGPTETDIRNVGSVDGLGGLLGSFVYDSDLEVLEVSNTVGNSGIISQNIRPYVDSDGTMSLSFWFKLKRTTGTLLADVPSLADNSNYTGLLEISEGSIFAGFVNKDGKQTVTTSGTVDSDKLTNISITYDGDVFTVYQNNVQIGQSSGITRTLFDNNNHAIEVGFGNNNLNYFHSSLPFANPGSNDMYGSIHRFSYFNRALSPEELTAYYQMEEYILSL